MQAGRVFLHRRFGRTGVRPRGVAGRYQGADSMDRTITIRRSLRAGGGAVLADCGHDPSLEQPGALKVELRSFVGDLAGGAIA